MAAAGSMVWRGMVAVKVNKVKAALETAALEAVMLVEIIAVAVVHLMLA